MTYETLLRYEKIYEERSEKEPYYKIALKELLESKARHPEHAAREEARLAAKPTTKSTVKK